MQYIFIPVHSSVLSISKIVHVHVEYNIFIWLIILGSTQSSVIIKGVSH